MGGVTAAARGGVTREPFESRGAEEVDLGPRSTLHAVDRAGPPMRAVGASIGTVTLDERPRELDDLADIRDGMHPVSADSGDGDDAAVVEALRVGADGAVDEEAVAGGVVAFADTPGWPREFRAVDLAGGAEAAAGRMISASRAAACGRSSRTTAGAAGTAGPSRAKRGMVMAGMAAWRSSPAAWLVAARPRTVWPAAEAAVAAAWTVVVLP